MLNVILDSFLFVIKVFSFYLYFWIDLSFIDFRFFNILDMVGIFVVEAVGIILGVFLFFILFFFRFFNFYNI